jgi:hypothetical protein
MAPCKWATASYRLNPYVTVLWSAAVNRTDETWRSRTVSAHRCDAPRPLKGGRVWVVWEPRSRRGGAQQESSHPPPPKWAEGHASCMRRGGGVCLAFGTAASARGCQWTRREHLVLKLGSRQQRLAQVVLQCRTYHASLSTTSCQPPIHEAKQARVYNSAPPVVSRRLPT